MKRFKLILVFLILSFLLLTTLFQSLACTVFVVGKDASADGSTMVTVEQDKPMLEHRLWMNPAKDHEPGSMRRCPDYPQLQRWHDLSGNPIDADNVAIAYDRQSPLEGTEEVLEIPEVEHTYAYMASVFAVMNEHQVGFAMPTVSCSPELWNDEGQLRITQLTMIAAERAKTAREAIQIMGELAEKYGFRGEFTPGKGLGLIDKEEAWIFHVIQAGPFWEADSGEPGAVWAAQRVPDDEVAVFANGILIDEIDFDDTENFMYSSNLKSFTEEMDYWDSESGESFNFRNVFLKGENNPEPSRFRQWRGLDLVAPSLNLPDPDEQVYLKGADGGHFWYPFSVKPDKPVTLTDLFTWTRDNLEGTKFDLTKGPLAGPFGPPQRTQGYNFSTKDGKQVREPQAIAHDNGKYTEVLQARSWLPDPIGGLAWYSPGRPKTAFRVPFYCGVNDIPPSHAEGDQYTFEWGEDSAWWAATAVNTIAQGMYKYIIEDVKVKQNELESEAMAMIPAIDKQALELYESDPEKAREFLTSFCSRFATDATRRWWDLAEHLILKYANRFVNLPEVCQKPKMHDEDYWIEEALKYQEEVRGRSQEDLGRNVGKIKQY